MPVCPFTSKLPNQVPFACAHIGKWFCFTLVDNGVLKLGNGNTFNYDDMDLATFEALAFKFSLPLYGIYKKTAKVIYIGRLDEVQVSDDGGITTFFHMPRASPTVLVGTKTTNIYPPAFLDEVAEDQNAASDAVGLEAYLVDTLVSKGMLDGRVRADVMHDERCLATFKGKRCLK